MSKSTAIYNVGDEVKNLYIIKRGEVEVRKYRW